MSPLVRGRASMIRCRQKGIDNDYAMVRSGQCVTRKSCAVLKCCGGFARVCTGVRLCQTFSRLSGSLL